MKLMPILMLSILSGAVAIAPERANAVITVIDLDLFGGDCTAVGVFSIVTATCTLTVDLTDSVVMAADGMTLDCDGHSITGVGGDVGIELSGRTGVVITNCTVTNFDDGISLTNSDGNTLINNTASGNLVD